MREDQVENGVKFLIHPKVKTAPFSQRISFLENKGLTSEEISAALSRVESQGGGENSLPSSFGGDATTTGGGASGIFASTQPFPAEPPVPLWRKVAVPGALVLGAVGVLGTYHAASRSAGTSTLNSSGDSGGMAYTSNSAAIGGAERADEGGGNAAQENADYTDASFAAPQRLEDGAAYSPFVGGTAVFPRSVGDLPAAGDSSILAGEFRRLTETMEQQTGHLVEAVSAMKALASRAEQDSSSLLAARVSSHTSELRAELGTIKQLLLLQAGGGGGGGGDKGTVATAGVAGAERVDIQVPSDRSKDSGIGESTSMSGDGDAKGGRGVEMASGGEAGRVPVAPLSEKEEQEKAREDKAAAEAAELAATERRKTTARMALTSLLADNAPQAAKDGIAMLRMLVANLVKQPNVPRYRRIATSNDNFKKRLLPLEGHRAMMEAIGFKSKGTLWEWTWHEDSGPSASSSNKAVLEDIVSAIDAVARPNGPPLPTSPPRPSGTVGPSHSDASITQTIGAALSGANANGGVGKADATAAVSGASSGGAAAPGVGGGGAKSLSGGIRQEPTATASVKGVLAAAIAVNGTEGGAGEEGRSDEMFRPPPAVVVAPRGGEGAVTSEPRGVGAVVPESGSREASPPVSMAEVAAAIQRGEEPPGIKVVEDRLSADAPGLAVNSKPSPPKPWEAVSAAGAGGFLASEGGGVNGAGGTGAGVSGRGYKDGVDGVALPASPSLPPQSPQRAVSVGP